MAGKRHVDDGDVHDAHEHGRDEDHAHADLRIHGEAGHSRCSWEVGPEWVAGRHSRPLLRRCRRHPQLMSPLRAPSTLGAERRRTVPAPAIRRPSGASGGSSLIGERRERDPVGAIRKADWTGRVSRLMLRSTGSPLGVRSDRRGTRRPEVPRPAGQIDRPVRPDNSADHDKEPGAVSIHVHWFLPTTGDSREFVGFGPTFGHVPRTSTTWPRSPEPPTSSGSKPCSPPPARSARTHGSPPRRSAGTPGSSSSWWPSGPVSSHRPSPPSRPPPSSASPAVGSVEHRHRR